MEAVAWGWGSPPEEVSFGEVPTGLTLLTSGDNFDHQRCLNSSSYEKKKVSTLDPRFHVSYAKVTA